MADKKKTEITFTKRALLASEKYAKMKYLLSALLTEDKQYTLTEVDKLVNDYLRKGVK
jgi:hypothetical protein